ncbi:ATP-dependent RNA helicase, partial [Candidatus Uhrbacteria bacterium]|nr:ATP-dependent RNA helicase [Candidatus Uhrbacteria bacterium]
MMRGEGASLLRQHDMEAGGVLRELPILEHATEIKEAFQKSPTLVIVGETGSGKTTEVPGMLLDVSAPGTRIAITQPRKIAARSIAKFVAERRGGKVGDAVGYRVHFEDATSEGTRMTFMTDGIILRQLQTDPLLRKYDVVMVDEAHERSTNIDVLLGLLRRVQEERERQNIKPLKIVVASATLEKEKMQEFFKGAPLVEVPGRLFPITEHFLPPMPEEKELDLDYVGSAVDTVKKVLGKEGGDILIFMPGEDDIRATIQEIKETEGMQELECIPLYGQLDPAEQDKIFQKPKGRRVIVATNIAETSITPPYVTAVIDSGLIKQVQYDPDTDFERLAVVCHSQAGCTQRKGRAGRLQAGEYYALFSQESFLRRPKFTKPEIQRSSLGHVVLAMKKIGIHDVATFPFVDAPDPKQLIEAEAMLQSLGALDADGAITEMGKEITDYPLEPKLGRMLIEAQRRHCAESVATIVAFLGNGRSVFFRPKEEQKVTEARDAHRQFHISSSDYLTYLKIWRTWEESDFDRRWAFDHFLNAKVLDEVGKTRSEILKILRRNGAPPKEGEDVAIAKSIASGLLTSLFVQTNRRNFSYQRQRDGQKGFKIHPGSSTFSSGPEIMVAHTIRESQKRGAPSATLYVMNVQALNPQWLLELAPHLVQEGRPASSLYSQESPSRLIFDRERGVVVREKTYTIKGTDYTFTAGEQEKGDVAAKFFVDEMMLYSEKASLPVIRENILYAEMLKDIYHRGGGKTPLVTMADLRSFYQKQLQGATSIVEAQALGDV